MNQPLLLSILATGFTVAFFHAAIPTHWLPFALTARAQGWNRGKTLVVTALAGSGHVLFTTALGVLVAYLGMTVERWTGQVFPWIAGGILFAFGLFFLVRQTLGHGHVHFLGLHHHHDHDEHGHDDHVHVPALFSEPRTFHAPKQPVSDRTAIVSLLALLTFSPCEGFLPIYVSAVHYGWTGFALSSAVLAVATLAGMLTFTSLTMAGLERIQVAALEKYESAILGSALCILAVVIILLEG